MSGLAAGIRLAQFGKTVLLVERHNAPGGLNSFYSLGGRKYDVGLHAVTNYVEAGVRGTPLGKLCRQLRIPREAFGLAPQRYSRIAFPGIELRFTNQPDYFTEQVAEVFPAAVDSFRGFERKVLAFDDTNLDQRPQSTRAILKESIPDPLLREMLLCPILYYGSARPRDIDFDQFVTMYKALFREGFARPLEGVRRIIRVLLQRYRETGGERRMKCGVSKLHINKDRIHHLELDDGTELTADHVLSSIGSAETQRLLVGTPETAQTAADEASARLSFAETITVLDTDPDALGCEETITFFNDSPVFDYASPEEDLIDPRSGVICFPNNYQYPADAQLEEGFLRVTSLASHARWTGLTEEEYQAAKNECYERMQDAALRFLPGLDRTRLATHTRDIDMFTPRTIEKFTGHLGGAVYGSPHKSKDGRTSVQNLYLCGTDQGFLGIVGALLSGISMANLHILGK